MMLFCLRFLDAPVVFGPKHLQGTLVVFLLIALLLVLLLKIVKVERHKRVLQITTIFLLIMEACKQGLSISVSGGTYPTWALPFQLCSVSLYLMPIVAFTKGRLAKIVTPGCFSIGMFASLAMFIYPSTVLGTLPGWLPLEGNGFPYISFAYHGAMLFFSMYLLFSKTYRPEAKEFYRAYVTLLFFAGLAMIANAIFGTDMMFLNTGYGNPLQFILLNNGRLVYMLFMSALAMIILAIPYYPDLIHKMRSAAHLKHRI
ncbi:MAG: hypothetical protein WC351_04275 [Candidatus Izemoplasmatales bacterium]|jgi:uncharacterized membrane protein YwaF